MYWSERAKVLYDSVSYYFCIFLVLFSVIKKYLKSMKMGFQNITIIRFKVRFVKKNEQKSNLKQHSTINVSFSSNKTLLFLSIMDTKTFI